MWMSIALGLALLTVGAELLVRGAVGVARRFGLSELLIGLTLVGFATSAPELVSSLQAAFAGAPGVALGNVVGSNIANVFLILGLAALIRPVASDPRAFRRDGAALVVATATATAFAFMGVFERYMGAIMLAMLVGYLALAYLQERPAAAGDAVDAEGARHEAAAEEKRAPNSALYDLLFTVLGLALLVFGARFLVGGAIELARDFGVSDSIIGLTVVAIGTSLPELVTSVVAAIRGKSDIALGNVVGSNIYNLLGILGATALAHPFAAAPEILAFDIWVMAAATAGLLVFAATEMKVTRFEGAVFLVAYVAYMLWLARLA